MQLSLVLNFYFPASVSWMLGLEACTIKPEMILKFFHYIYNLWLLLHLCICMLVAMYGDQRLTHGDCFSWVPGISGLAGDTLTCLAISLSLGIVFNWCS